MTMGDGLLGDDSRLNRSGATYTGTIRLPKQTTCGRTPIDEFDTVRFRVRAAEFMKGIWTATRLSGTLIQEVPASHGCGYGYAVVQFKAWFYEF
jgi:hypothetical protein